VQVKEEKDITPGSVTLSDDETDKLLADALLTDADTGTAISATMDLLCQPVRNSEGSWQLVTPSYLYIYAEQTQSILKRLTPHCADGYRRNVAESLTARLTQASEITDMLMKCISEVQHDREWTPEEENQYPLIAAKFSRISNDQPASEADLKMLFASKTFRGCFPEDEQYRLRLLTDTSGYRLGVYNFTSTPMHFVSILNDSLAYSFGLRSDDTVLSADGTPYKTIYEFKLYLKERQGKTVHVTVMRGGKETKIKMHIPDNLVKPSEQAR
jgi:hypothetical protein